MSSKYNFKTNIYSILNKFSLIILFLLLDSPNFSFGIPGPYSHEEIQLKTLAGFAATKNVEINYFCANILTQSNYQVDAFLPNNDNFHCDNSNFVGCSNTIYKLIKESYINDSITGLRKIGYSLHIIQDFYAHSNWVENVENSEFLAPIELMRNPAFLLLFPNIQSGWVGYIPIDLEEQYECFLEKQDRWKLALPGSTHACMSKDSNKTLRGGALSIGNPTKTYHELAGELAIKHSIKLLNELYSKNHPALLGCIVPKLGTNGCRHAVQRQLK